MFKQIKKKSIALICAVSCMLMPAAGNMVSAADVLTDKMILDLQAFEILSGLEDGELHLENAVTRAQMCRIVSTVMQLDGGYYNDKAYTDVSESHWAYSYINMLSGQGILNGYSDGTFRPDAPVKYQEAVKIITVMLGYGLEAEKSGGYPNGYLSVGQRIGVTQGVGAAMDAELTRGQVMRMVYNSLDANRMVQNISTGNDITLEAAEDTFRDLLMGDSDEGMMRIKGVVTATNEFYLDTPNSDIDKNRIEIDGVVYDAPGSDISNYFGMTVSAYIRTRESGSYDVVRNFSVDKNNTAFTAVIDDVEELTNNKITYIDENGKRKTTRMAVDVQFLYNGRPVRDNDVSLLNIDKMHDATVKCISNTEDTSINVVMIDEYESYVVDRVNVSDKRIYLSENQRYKNARYIDADDEDDDTRVVTIRNAEGGLIGVDAIEDGDVVTVIASTSGDLTRIYTCSDAFEGKIGGMDGEERTMQIGGDSYHYENGVDTDNIFGKTVVIKLNYLGGIAYIDKEGSLETDGDYAAIVAYALNEEDGNVKLRMAFPGKISNEVEETESDDPDATEIPAIAAQNSEVKSVFTAPDVTIDNTKCSGTDAIIKALAKKMFDTDKNYIVVSYKMNDDGFVKKIDFLDKVPVVPEKYYASGDRVMIMDGDKKFNSYEKSFSGTTGGAFGLHESTLGICIPTNDTDIIDDYMAKIEMNNGQTYNVAAYQYNKTTHCPDIVIFNAEMHANTNGKINYGKAKIGLVRESLETIDEIGDEFKGIVMMTEDGLITAQFSETTTNDDDFSAIKAGDLIYYSLDSNDKLDGYELIRSCNPVPGDRYDSRNPANAVFVGKIIDADYRYVSSKLNKWIDSFDLIATGEDEKTFEIPIKNTPPIYIYDKSKSKDERIVIGTSDDFMSEHEKAIVVSCNDSVKAVTIIK